MGIIKLLTQTILYKKIFICVPESTESNCFSFKDSEGSKISIINSREMNHVKQLPTTVVHCSLSGM